MEAVMRRYRVVKGWIKVRAESPTGNAEVGMRVFLAERWISLFGRFGFWRPVDGAVWRVTEELARQDVEIDLARDIGLRQSLWPLSATKTGDA